MTRTVVDAYPAARTIHFVVDNLNTHREQALTDHFGPLDGHRLWSRLTVHYTPKHGSWLNQAEIELSLVSRQRLGDATHSGPRATARGDPGVGHAGESSEGDHRLAIHAEERATKVRIRKATL